LRLQVSMITSIGNSVLCVVVVSRRVLFCGL
jgi:hypothetical protein